MHGSKSFLGPVSRKSGNFTGYFRVSRFPLYLKNGEDLSRQTSQSVYFLLSSKHVKRSAFLNKRMVGSQMAFRAQKVVGTFDKQAPGQILVLGTKEKVVSPVHIAQNEYVLLVLQLQRSPLSRDFLT